MQETAIRDLAKRFFDVIEQGDIDTAMGFYVDDVAIWHNFDDLEQSKEENRATMTGMVSRLNDRSYAERRVEVIENGFVQQHVLEATRKDGVRLRMPAVIIARLRDGKIARIDEYLDSAQVAEFRKTFD